MGVTSLILGIISLTIGWLPFVCFIMLALAIVGVILGAIDIRKKSKIKDGKKGVGIAGLVISALAIPIITISSIMTIGVYIYAINNDVVNDVLNDYNYIQDGYNRLDT